MRVAPSATHQPPSSRRPVPCSWEEHYEAFVEPYCVRRSTVRCGRSDRYRRRLERLGSVLSQWSGLEVTMPAGGFYLWFDAGDGWDFAERLARDGGALVSPGDFYGDGGAQNVRAAVVQPHERIELIASRLGVGR